jgi:UDP-glucose 4-epimerase
MSIKRILITGSNSYVGTNVELALMSEPEKYYVETISVRGDGWKSHDFSKFDVVFHVAGIAHISPKKNMRNLYYLINRDLTIKIANKAKQSGVKQFVYMSSMIVYSSKETRITKDTIPNPDNFYGNSKLQAEKGLFSLKSEDFLVTIIRSPMIYGKNSKGNFNKLFLLNKFSFILTNYSNKRSFIFIDHLAEYVKKIIHSNISGIIFPQNNQYFSLFETLKCFRIITKKKFITIPFSNLLIRFLIFLPVFRKLFSDFYYDINDSIEIVQLSLIDTYKITFKEKIKL